MEKINYRLAQKIKDYIRKEKYPLIILISGINGVGKTTIAFTLSNILEIKQRVGLGAIVKTLIATKPNDRNFLKMDNYFSSSLSRKDLHKQSLIISKVINLLIKKYYKNKVSCIIEGVQLLPQYLLNGKAIHFHVIVANLKKYKKQLQSCDTREPYKISKKSFSNLLKMNDFFKKEINPLEIYLLNNSESLVITINKILKNIAIKLNIV